MATAKRRGCQVPTQSVVLPYSKSKGKEAIKLYQQTGRKAIEWQKTLIEHILAYNKDKLWVHTKFGYSVPRRNGKNEIAAIREFFGLVNGEKILHTAHRTTTSHSASVRLAKFLNDAGYEEVQRVDKKKIYDKHYTYSKQFGLERITILGENGGQCDFRTRSGKGGLGEGFDLLIIDEAQELDNNQQASFLPAISASINPQTIYVGTPPDDTAYGDVFRKIRDRAIAGETKNVAWFEFSVEEIGDIADRDRWASTNPALGRRVMMTTIESEYEQLDTPTFARERLGWWKPVTQAKLDYAIDRDKWAECSSKESKPNGKTAYGIKFSADGAEVALCGAVIPLDGGAARISLIEYRPTGEGIQWLVDWLNERYKKASCVVIDGRNNVDLLVDRIADVWKAKGSVIRPGARDVVAAASMLINSINENSVSWFEQQESLNDSAVNAIKRNIGGGFGFGGDASAPIEACALALWGAKTAKRDPNRKMRIV